MRPQIILYLVLLLFLVSAALLLWFKWRRGRPIIPDLSTEPEPAAESPAVSRWRLVLPIFCMGLALLFLIAGKQLATSVMKVQVIVSGDMCQILLDGANIITHRGAGPASGGIGLVLNSEEGPRQAWRNIRVLSIDGKTELFRSTGETVKDGFVPLTGNWTREGSDGYALKGGMGSLLKSMPGWRDYILEADLIDPTDAGIWVRAADANNRIEFWMRPQRHHDSGLNVIVNGAIASRANPTGPVGIRFMPLFQQLLGSIQRYLLVSMKLIIAGALCMGLLMLATFKLNKWRGLWNLSGGLLLLAFSLLLLALFPNSRFRMIIIIAGIAGLIHILLPLFWKRCRGWFDTMGDLPAALVLAAGFIAAASWICIVVLQAMPHVQDSCVVYFQAKILAMGRTWLPSFTPPLYRFFDHEFIVNHNGRWFGIYPPGAPFVLMLGLLAGLPWIVNPVMGAIGLFFTYLAGREAFGRTTGLIALALGCVSSFALILSASFMSHAPCMAFLALFTWGFIAAWQKKKKRFALIAGLALGAAVLTRPQSAAAYALPFIIASLAELLNLFRKRSAWREMTGRYACLCGGALFGVLLLLLFNWSVTGHPFQFPMRVYSPWIKFGFRNDVGIEWTQTHTPANGMANVLYNLAELELRLFGWETGHKFFTRYPGISLAFLFIPFVTGLFKKWDVILAGAYLAMAGMFFTYFAHGVCYGPRFWFECLPVFLLLTARGLALTFEFLPHLLSWWRGRRYQLEEGPALLLILPLLFFLTFTSLKFDLRDIPNTYRSYNGMSRDGLEFIKQRGIHNALVFIRAKEAWQQYGKFFWEMPLTLDSDIIYARDQALHNVGSRGSTPIPNMELMKQFPGRKYYYLDGFNLQEIPGPGQ